MYGRYELYKTIKYIRHKLPQATAIDKWNWMFACTVLFQCQYHIDCCSKNCRTYSYKCVRSFKEIPQVGQATMPQLQPVAEGGILTIQPVNSIDELVNRFGNDGNESMPSTETPTITTITMSNSSLLHATNQNKNSNNNMYFGITTPIVCLASGLRVSSRYTKIFRKFNCVTVILVLVEWWVLFNELFVRSMRNNRAIGMCC